MAAGGRPRPMLNNNAVGGRGKRAPGFNGFKAPPATDLIDQLLLEQDQNSLKKKAPAGRGRGGGGFLKAPPKTDMIDALLLSGANEDEEDDKDSLVNDG